MSKAGVSNMQIISRISKGHKFTLECMEYTVIGSQQIRGNYLYIVRNESTGQKQSIKRENMLDWQKDGLLKFKM